MSTVLREIWDNDLIYGEISYIFSTVSIPRISRCLIIIFLVRAARASQLAFFFSSVSLMMWFSW